MNFKKFLMIPLFAALPLVTGCGSDCKSVCEDENGCAGVTKKADCSDFCDKSDELASDANCSSQYDDALSCAADKKDQCTSTDTSCDAKENAVGACILTYCMKSENAAKCTAWAAAAPQRGSDN